MPRQQVPRPASFFFKRMQLFISASVISLGEVAAVHFLALSGGDGVCLLFVRAAVLDVYHLLFTLRNLNT